MRAPFSASAGTWSVLALLAAGGACFPEPECQEDADCVSTGEICIAGVCGEPLPYNGGPVTAESGSRSGRQTAGSSVGLATRHRVHLDFCTGGCPSPRGTIPASPLSPGARGQVLGCLRDLFAGYDITFDTVPPAAGAVHRHVIVTTDSSVLGLTAGLTGIVNPTCQNDDGAVMYVFNAAVGTAPRTVCEFIAQEIGYTAALDNVVDCRDVMHIGHCGTKTFTNRDIECGETTARTCRCGGTTQNANKVLLRELGRR